MPATSRGHRSLIWTLVWGLTLPTFALIAVVITILTHQLSSTVKGLRQATLSSQAEEIIKSLSVDTNGTLSLRLPDPLRRIYQDHNDFSYAILDQAGTALFASRTLKPLNPLKKSQSKNEINYFRIHTAKNQKPVYGATIRFNFNKMPYWIQVTQSGLREDVLFDSVVEDFLESLGWAFIILLVALLAINIVIIARSLRPLRVVQTQAAAIGPATTDIRLPEDKLPSEILPLVHAINSAFERLEHGFRTQREFTANAAHELRTPLAVLTARIGRLPDKTESAPLLDDVRVMNRIVSQLLKVSQLESVSIGHDEQVDLAEVAIEVATYLGPLAIENERSISVTGADTPIIVPGNAELLGHAVRNLVENALYHTQTGTAVIIDVGANGTISVSDEGEGIPEADREKIFQRFWRAQRSGNGAGIGLAIVNAIVQLHGGRISVKNGENKHGNPCGTKFIIELPLR